MQFTHYRQLDAMDCGPTCLRMVTKHYGKSYKPCKNCVPEAALHAGGVSLPAHFGSGRE